VFREIDNLLVRIHFIIVMIRWTGLAPWEYLEDAGGAVVRVAERYLAPVHLRAGRDVRLPGKGNSNTHGARPVHLGRV